jgi:hypothetical protein
VCYYDKTSYFADRGGGSSNACRYAGFLSIEEKRILVPEELGFLPVEKEEYQTSSFRIPQEQESCSNSCPQKRGTKIGMYSLGVLQ